MSMNSTPIDLPEFNSLDATAGRKLPIWPVASIGILLVLAIALPAGFITVMNSCLLFLAAIVWFTSHTRLPPAFLKIVLPFLAICVIGLLSGIGADRYLYFKDAWYISNAGLIVAVGFVLYRAKPDLERGLRAFVLGGTVVAVSYIVPFTLDPSLLLLEAAQSRGLVGNGHFAPALASLLLVSSWKNANFSLRMPKWLAMLCFGICVAATVVSFSRTIILTTALGLLAVFGVFSRRVWARVLIVLAISALLITVLKTTVDVDSSDAKNTFIGKLARSLEEMTMQEFVDLKHINEDYRGYESARALHAYEAGPPWRWVIGQGFGAVLDIKLWVPGVGRYLPVLHNGYFYLLLKGGALSVALFLFSLWTMYKLGWRAANSEQPTAAAVGSLMQGVALGLLLTTWVIAGVFNKVEMFPFLLCAGFLSGYLTERVEIGTR